MLPKRGGTLACAAALLVACGEEVPRQAPEEAEETFGGHACELVTASELSQLFVGRLEPVPDEPAGDTTCTWRSEESGEVAFRYQVRPYVENLETGVLEFAPDGAGEPDVEMRQGLGEAAVWTSFGLFVSRNGRTLQLMPFEDDSPRAIYEELASLLLERLEADRRATP